MRRRFLILSTLFGLSFSASCSAKPQSGHAHNTESGASKNEAKGRYFNAKIINWRVGPEVSGDSLSDINNACVIEITTPTGEKPDTLSVQDVFPFMKVHGHGAPDDQIVYTLDGNQVTVSKIAFTMSGPWELHVKATVNGQSEELEIPIVVP